MTRGKSTFVRSSFVTLFFFFLAGYFVGDGRHNLPATWTEIVDKDNIQQQQCPSEEEIIRNYLARQQQQQQHVLVEGQSKEEDATSLRELFKQSGTDKLTRHHYDNFYSKWLEPYRRLPQVSMLEIGADKGKSLATWEKYFMDPKLIIGLAYGQPSEGVEDKVAQFNFDKTQVVRGDQYKVETMQQLKAIGPFDVIIDDGSHVPQHMIFSLFHLWESVKPGGLYIIEDLETNYWPHGTKIFGYALQNTGIGHDPIYNAVEKMKQLVDVLQQRQLGAPYLTVMPGDKEVCEVWFAHNAVALRRCTEEEMKNLASYNAKRKMDTQELQNWVAKAKESNPQGFN